MIRILIDDLKNEVDCRDDYQGCKHHCARYNEHAREMNNGAGEYDSRNGFWNAYDHYCVDHASGNVSDGAHENESGDGDDQLNENDAGDGGDDHGNRNGDGFHENDFLFDGTTWRTWSGEDALEIVANCSHVYSKCR